jgi:hypothetical protein
MNDVTTDRRRRFTARGALLDLREEVAEMRRLVLLLERQNPATASAVTTLDAVLRAIDERIADLMLP